MAKIKINLDPAELISFERVVTIPTPDGKGLKIQFVFKYRTREELADLFASYIERAVDEKHDAELQADAGGDTRSSRETIAEAVQKDVRTVLDLAIGWNVENHPFDGDSLTRLFHLFPGAAFAIVTDYRVSLTEGRLGN